MIWYHGEKKRSSWFEGWHLKCQTKDGRCLALIPAIHVDDSGDRTASIQVITLEQPWWLKFLWHGFRGQKESFRVQIADNVFWEHGLELKIHDDGIDLNGSIILDPSTPLRYSIMEPFEFLPNMECAHGVINMKHTLTGEVHLNGEKIDFDGGIGYIELDRGRSFPSSYLWAQDT